MHAQEEEEEYDAEMEQQEEEEDLGPTVEELIERAQQEQTRLQEANEALQIKVRVWPVWPVWGCLPVPVPVSETGLRRRTGISVAGVDGCKRELWPV